MTRRTDPPANEIARAIRKRIRSLEEELAHWWELLSACERMADDSRPEPNPDDIAGRAPARREPDSLP